MRKSKKLSLSQIRNELGQREMANSISFKFFRQGEGMFLSFFLHGGNKEDHGQDWEKKENVKIDELQRREEEAQWIRKNNGLSQFQPKLWWIKHSLMRFWENFFG